MVGNKIIVSLLLVAGCVQAATYEDWARVVDSQPQYDQPSRRQVCNGSGSGSSGPGVGTAIGAVAGGLLGSQVGKGNGRVAAAAGGAVVGALSGNYIENKNSNGGNCYTEESGGRINGYRVTYDYAGRTFTEVFQTPPQGDSIRVRVNVGAR